MTKEPVFIEVDLDNEQKQIILDKAAHFVYHDVTKADLNNKRKKWIRFDKDSLDEVIGELSYYYNRSTKPYESMMLDELILQLEFYQKNR